MEPLHLLIVHPSSGGIVALSETLTAVLPRECQFSVSNSGEDALRKAENSGECPLDCIFVSDELDDMDAFELLAALKSDAMNSSVPILVITEADRNVGLKFLRAGAEDYFDQQRTDPEDLSKVVENALERCALAGERRRKNLEIAESEDFLRRVLDNLFAFVGVLLPDGTLVNANEAPLKIAGLTKEDVIGKKFWDCFWWNFSKDSQDRLQAAIETAGKGEVVRYDAKVQVSGGTTIWIDFQLAPLRDPSGNITHLIPSGMDISERKKIEQGERRTRQKLRAVFDGTREFVVLLDANGVLLDANRSALRFGGRSHSEVVGQLFWNTFWFDQSREAAEAVQNAVNKAAGGEVATFELEIVNAQGAGKLFDFSFSPVRNDAGETMFIVPVGVDITERKQAEMTLRENDQRLRLATAATSVGIWESNIITGQINWDRQMFEIYGLEPTESGALDFSTWQNTILPEDVPAQTEILTETIRQRGQSRREFRIRRGDDDTIRIIQAVETVRSNDKGQAEWIVGTNLDITERKRREANLAFMGELQAGFAKKTSGEEIMEFATSRIAEHLGMDHCTMFEVIEKNNSVVVLYDHSVEGAIEIKGEIPMKSFLTQDEMQKIVSGEPMSVDDVSLSPRPGWMVDSFVSLGIGAVANAGHLANGRCKFLLHLSKSKPYRWHQHEIELLAELSSNIYLRLERARTEEALRESEELYRETFEHTAIGMAQLEMDGRWVWVNQAVSRITGYSKDELMALTFADITHPEDLDEDLDQLKLLTEGEISTYTLEKRYLRKDQSTVWVNLTVTILRDSQGKPMRYISAIEDISAKRKAQEELDKERLFVERLTQVVPNMLYLFEIKEPRIVWVNRHVKEALGYSEQEVIEMGSLFMPSIMHPDDQERVAEHLSKSVMAPDGVASEVEYRLKRRDGEWRWFRTHDTPFTRDAEGDVKELIGISVDITQQKVNEAMLHDTAQRKDEFLAMLGHELRNPLGAIRHAVAFEKELEGDREATEWCREVVDRQSMQLSRMIEDLLNVARITKGQIPKLNERLDLVKVLKNAVAVGRALTEPGELTLIVEIDAQELNLVGDGARLEQVFVNLLNNAAKYTPAGGQIRLVAHREGGQAVIAIEDTGVGIAEDHLPGLFELFRQVETTLDRSQGGLGIGLTVVKSLVEAHGGTVNAASEGKDKGCTFTVRLPLELTAPEEAAITVPVPNRESKMSEPVKTSCKVLIVDDHKDAAQGLSRLLAHRGYEVRVAHDGLLGLETAEAFEPEILLLDLGLPGLDGYELAKRLRKKEKFTNAYLVAISGYAQESDLIKSRDAGFDHHFAKPLEVAKLLSLIGDTLKKRA